MVDKLLGLTAGCAVADAYSLYLVLADECHQFVGRLYALALWWMGVDGFVVKQIALAVKTYHLASGTETGVDGEHPLLSQWRRHEQLLQVAHEDAYSLLVGFLLGESGKLGLDAGCQQTLVAVLHSLAHTVCRLAVTANVLAFQFLARLVGVDADAHSQYAFSLAAAHGKQAVARASVEWFVPVEIVAILLTVLLSIASLGALHHLADNVGGASELSAYGLARAFVLAHHLGDDVHGTLHGVLGRVNALLLVDERLCLVQNRVGKLPQEPCCHWFESGFACHLGTCAALLLVGQVDVLQFGGVPAALDATLQLVGHLALLLDGREDGLLALLQFLEFVETVADACHLHLVHSTAPLLAVAADERYGGSLFEQFHHVLDIFLLKPCLFGYQFVEYHVCHSLLVCVRSFSFIEYKIVCIFVEMRCVHLLVVGLYRQGILWRDGR